MSKTGGIITMRILDKNGSTKKIQTNRRRAIREKCLNCAGWYPSVVERCDNESYQQPCPLHPFRSGQGKQNAKERARAIRDYCFWCMNDQPGEVSKCPSTLCPLFPYRQSAVDRSVNLAEN